EVIVYPKFDNERVYHDVAILRLRGSMQLGPDVDVVKTNYEDLPANTNVTFGTNACTSLAVLMPFPSWLGRNHGGWHRRKRSVVLRPGTRYLPFLAME